ncbi:MAG: HD domain-containing protein [Chloroflexi bacterium]|nr:HD domain-containing protein [Chloroflexota bacterium]
MDMARLFSRKTNPDQGPKGPSQPVRTPIRLKITLPYLLLAIILALGATYMIYRIVFDNIDERFTNQLIEAGKISSDWMVREEDRLLETLRLLSYTQGTAQAVLDGDAQRLRELSIGIALNNSEEVIEFLDVQGSPILTMRHRTGGNLEDYTYSQGGEKPVPQWPFVEKVLQRQTDALGDKYSGEVSDDFGNTFYVAGPIYNEHNELAGVVLVGKTLPTLVHQMRDATLAQVTLYNLDGQPAASTHLDTNPLNQDTVSQILLRMKDSSLKRDLNNLRDISSSSVNYAEILAPWQARGGETLGLMGVSLAKTFLVSTSRVTRMQILGLAGLAFLLVTLLGINLANLITRPLLGLVRASMEVSRGNLQVSVPSTSDDEVGILAHSFNQMVGSLYQSKEDLLQAYDSTLEGWSKALELRDEETEGHTQRVTQMTVRLAEMMGIQGEDLVNIRRGALLHDIGKMGVPDAILRKPGPLTDEEWVLMRKHPEYAIKMLWEIEYLHPALEIPGSHHEKWDGSGYPKGLKGTEIPLAARIFAIIDVWDALRSDRPYRKCLPQEEVMEILLDGRGSHFDPEVTDLFLKHLPELTAPILASFSSPSYEHPLPSSAAA